nr:hypothetical protein [Tanacetum cinerariifolium]
MTKLSMEWKRSKKTKSFEAKSQKSKPEGRIVGNKIHKAFLVPGIEFPLAEEVPTASKEGCHCQKKRDATARKIALLSKSRRNCQSKSNDSFTKSPLVIAEGISES